MDTVGVGEALDKQSGDSSEKVTKCRTGVGGGEAQRGNRERAERKQRDLREGRPWLLLAQTGMERCIRSPWRPSLESVRLSARETSRLFGWHLSSSQLGAQSKVHMSPGKKRLVGLFPFSFHSPSLLVRDPPCEWRNVWKLGNKFLSLAYGLCQPLRGLYQNSLWQRWPSY